MILPILYAGNIEYFSILLNSTDPIFLDSNEHFVKQSYRNRTEIYGANGKLSLIIPLVKRNKRTPMKDVLIDYSQNWQKLHWKSFESAYRSSPYFEFYEHQLKPFYKEKKHEKLVDFNLALLELILKLLKEEVSLGFTVHYEEVEGIDYRKEINPKKSKGKLYPSENYLQVFEAKQGYISNLSILDLLFNEGPNAINFLKNGSN